MCKLLFCIKHIRIISVPMASADSISNIQEKPKEKDSQNSTSNGTIPLSENKWTPIEKIPENGFRICENHSKLKRQFQKNGRKSIIMNKIISNSLYNIDNGLF